MANRRRDVRVSLPLEARFEGLSGKHTARLSDLSVGGCYVETLSHVSIGEAIQFRIHLPTGRWLRLRGEVVYHQRNVGFGVRFVDLTDEEREMLGHIVEYGS